MNIIEKVLEIYKDYSICPHCIGRMFSLLATNTTNFERGNSILLTTTMQLHKDYLSQVKNEFDPIIANLKNLAERSKYDPARNVLENEGLGFSNQHEENKCYLCQDIFSNLNVYVESAMEKLEKYEYESLLVGTNLSAEIVNREDTFKAKYEILESESFKNHFNREVGKILTQRVQKNTEFKNPDITVIFSLSYDSVSIDLLIRSLFIYGKYQKLIRGIPQTHWDCRKCRGSGCEACNYTGKQYSTSVEELISPKFIEISDSTASKFHGAGREDIDVRMLGDGRPFILELKNPIIRHLDLKKLKKYVNKKNRKKIKIEDLRYSSKDEVKKIKSKAENVKKQYLALVESPNLTLSKEKFLIFQKKVADQIIGRTILQKTPLRVSHRRADKIREKRIYNVEGTFLKPSTFKFIIETQGGTYIKELINGDQGRTSPSFSEIFGTPLICKELDVINIGL
jgi:tRNA pseudouridine synthase 10